MILVGLGSNLITTEYNTSSEVIREALRQIEHSGVRLLACSPLYSSAPLPASDQNWFINAVASVETSLSPNDTLALLHSVESKLGRKRARRWDARLIDLDLLAYDQRVIAKEAEDGLILPHPRMHERGFVLAPLADLAPLWSHPILKQTAMELLTYFCSDQNYYKING